MSMATINGYEVIQGTSGAPKDPWHNIRLRQESDPNNLDPHEPGAKLDSGKPLTGVLHDFALALQSVALVGSYGAAKYSRGGWQQVPDASTRYFDAMWRHLLASRHEEIDPESGLSHFAAVCWNVLAIEELNQRAKL